MKDWSGERMEPGVQNEAALEHLHRYALAMELARGKTVLDIACGEGYGAALLAGVAKEVTGMDIRQAVVSAAQKKYGRSNLYFSVSSISSIAAPDASFDLVVCWETLEHVRDHAQVLRELRRVLKPGGLLLISTPDKKQYSEQSGYHNPHHQQELYGHEFKALLQEHFTYYRFLRQAPLHASLIWTGSVERIEFYEGDFTHIEKRDTPEALYWIGLASDRELPNVNGSLFLGQQLFSEALRVQEQMIMGTITYRIGRLALLPFSFIRNLFRR